MAKVKNPDESLTLELVRETFSYDPSTGIFRWREYKPWRNSSMRAGVKSGKGYRYISLKKWEIREHRLAWFYVYGEWPKGKLDHINGIRDDNRISNLRECTDAENQQNRGIQANNTTGYLGVFRVNGRFGARIMINRKGVSLGVYDTAEEAHVAYLKAKAELHPFSSTERLASFMSNRRAGE